VGGYMANIFETWASNPETGPPDPLVIWCRKVEPVNFQYVELDVLVSKSKVSSRLQAEIIIGLPVAGVAKKFPLKDVRPFDVDGGLSSGVIHLSRPSAFDFTVDVLHVDSSGNKFPVHLNAVINSERLEEDLLCRVWQAAFPI